MLIITSLYASLLAFLVMFLTFRVIKARRSNNVVIGDNGNQEVLHAIGLSSSVGVSFGRIAGIMLTMLTILVLSGLNIYHFIKELV